MWGQWKASKCTRLRLLNSGKDLPLLNYVVGVGLVGCPLWLRRGKPASNLLSAFSILLTTYEQFPIAGIGILSCP